MTSLFCLNPLPPCHSLSLFCLNPSPPRPVTYFLNGPIVTIVLGLSLLLSAGPSILNYLRNHSLIVSMFCLKLLHYKVTILTQPYFRKMLICGLCGIDIKSRHSVQSDPPFQNQSPPFRYPPFCENPYPPVLITTRIDPPIMGISSRK